MRLARLLRWAVQKLYVTEVIGQEECPMMLRWTLLNLGKAKLLLHYFPPNVSDTDPHDHPRPFVTLILKGGYWNVEFKDPENPTMEWIGRGAIRYRPASHTHMVETGDRGAWSIVAMGPMMRPWGFLRNGEWWPWKAYVQAFGGTIRCEEGSGFAPHKPDDPSRPDEDPELAEADLFPKAAR